MFLDWQTDGMLARAALVLLGIALLALVLPKMNRNSVLRQLLQIASLWHFTVFCFTAFWLIPHYAESGADCQLYHENGMIIASQIRAGDWASIPWGWNTNAMQILTGFVYTPFGGDVYGMMFFSAVLGFCGSLFLCLAFSLWASPVLARRYALIVLFLPSFAMWTGIFGKDSWVALGLGLAAYGYASKLKLGGSGIGYLALGLVITTVIRPHIAVTVAIAAAIAYIWVLTASRKSSILTKIQMVVLLAGMVVGLAVIAQGFLGIEDASVDTLQSYGETKGADNASDGGGSTVQIATNPGIAGTMINFPRAIIRILFEPFPWNAHNLNSALASAENVFLFVFICTHVGLIRRLFRSMFREPYVLFSCILALGLLLMFSLLPNLGLLSRERAQLLPFVFVPLVSAEALRKRRRSSGLNSVLAPTSLGTTSDRLLANGPIPQLRGGEL